MKQSNFSAGAAKEQADQERAAVDQRRRHRRTGRHLLHYLLVTFVAAAIMVALSLTVFFKIEQIEVTGVTKYAAEELIEASGVQKGDNLFRVSEKQVYENLTTQFPYVEQVHLKRSYPARLTLEITQAKPLGAADTAAGYILIGNSGRILESGVQTLSEDVTIVTGMYLSDITEGRVLGTVISEGEIIYPADMEPLEEVDEKGRKKKQSDLEKEEAERRTQAAQEELEGFQLLQNLVQAVTETEFTDITLVDIADPLNMMMVYQNRIIIELGSQMDLDYKLQFVKHILENELNNGFEGILDASVASSAKEVWSDPCDVEQELAKRKLTAAAKAAGEQKPASDPNEGVTNPNLTVIPNSSSQAQESTASTLQKEDSSASSNTEQSASEPVDYYAVIPNSASESESEPSAGSESVSAAD